MSSCFNLREGATYRASCQWKEAGRAWASGARRRDDHVPHSLRDMSSPPSDALERGLDAFRRRAWAEATDHLTTADDGMSLAPDVLERLATAAWLSGRDDESATAWTRAHSELLDRGDLEGGARCAFWLAFSLMLRGERERAGGWLGRARRLLEDADRDCVERGYLLVPAGLGSLAAGDAAAARERFERAAAAGDRFDDADLSTLGRLGRGQALIRMGEIEEGVALLDEVMAAVEAGVLSPIVAGTVYCAVIETCHEIFDLRRAAAWTEALARWCATQPELVPFRGQCLARRAQMLQVRGAWPDALHEVREACERLAGPRGEPAAGLAFYRRAELHRLRGEYEDAERAYREAVKWGRSPQPGLALLRLCEGRLEAAVSSIRREKDETDDRTGRCRVLPAHVEIMLAADDILMARASAEELGEIAAGLDAPFLHAVAKQAQGAVRLAEGDAPAALAALRDAADGWDALKMPYELARARVLIGLACREIGDEDTARVELEAAGSVFRRLEASPDVRRVESLLTRTAPDERHGLTPREWEVLELVAGGDTNKRIATALSISERTVERHVSNIFHKLGVSTRSAATAYAYEHDLI